MLSTNSRSRPWNDACWCSSAFAICGPGIAVDAVVDAAPGLKVPIGCAVAIIALRRPCSEPSAWPFAIGRVVDALHLGGIERLVIATFEPIGQCMDVETSLLSSSHSARSSVERPRHRACCPASEQQLERSSASPS